jgi:Tol biopolymer transport system component
MKLLKVVALVLVVISGYSQTKTPIVATDLMKIATTNQIQISPDGTKAVMVVNRKGVKNENEYYYTRNLYLLDLVNKAEPVQLTFGDKNDLSPQWSPDGKQILFVRADGDRSQLWLLPLSGGEAHAITKSEYGAGSAQWSPDGKKILYSASIPFSKIEGKTPWPYERPGRTQGDEPNFKNLKADERKSITNSPDGSLTEVRAWLAKNNFDNNPRVLVRQDFQGELNLSPEESFSHLFIKTIGSDEKDVQLTQGFQDFQSASWSPDGKSIICHSRAYKIHPDREQDNDLWIIDVASKTAKEFLTWPGYSISNPTYSPDGTQITFYTSATDNRHATQNNLAIVAAGGGKPSF